MDFNIHYEDNNTKNISIIGEVKPGTETKKLLKLLDTPNADKISITFFDANIFHSDIVERLGYLQKTAMCNVFVLKRYLYTYLNGLGVRSEYVVRKSLQKKNPAQALPLNKHDVSGFLESIYSKYGYDYRDYELGSIIRRIKISMLRENACDFKEFQNSVLKDEELFEQLFMDFSINTTSFFRDPAVYLALKNKVLPYLNSYAHIKIWCVGCSNGKEAYSLAILLDELEMLHKTQIYATDINPYIIEEANNGLYSIDEIDNDILNYQRIGGERNFVDYIELKGNYTKVKSYLQKNILFFQHSLIRSGILNQFQLILCRNVLIYFNPELQEKVLSNFHKSLDISGFLVLGKSEGMLLNRGHTYFTKYMDKEKIYRLS
jgi:chemotaxis protein methyltransferase CheR